MFRLADGDRRACNLQAFGGHCSAAPGCTVTVDINDSFLIKENIGKGHWNPRTSRTRPHTVEMRDGGSFAMLPLVITPLNKTERSTAKRESRRAFSEDPQLPRMPSSYKGQQCTVTQIKPFSHHFLFFFMRKNPFFPRNLFPLWNLTRPSQLYIESTSFDKPPLFWSTHTTHLALPPKLPHSPSSSSKIAKQVCRRRGSTAKIVSEHCAWSW